MIFLVLLFVALIALAFFVFWYFKKKKYLLRRFESNNTIVYGKKGTGKDVLFQYVINARKTAYLSNLNYGGNFEEITAKDLDIPGNDYHNFIKNDILICDKVQRWEGLDSYISDVGIYLPCQYDSLLHREFKSFPIFYALSRHLYNMNIHVNCQNLERVWKAIREQADSFIRCRGVVSLPFCLVVFWTSYEKYSSASQCLEPYKKPFGINRFATAEQRQFEATNGEIIKGFSIISKNKIKYDTRAFHEKIFGFKAPLKFVGKKK